MRRVRTDDGSPTLESERYGETYRSRRGAVRESRHVFVEGSGAAARLEGGEPTRVLEIGWGTAVNLALSATLALRHGTPLDYVALEDDPLSAADLAQVELERWADPAFVAALLAWRAGWSGGGPQTLRYGSLRLEVVVADATVTALPAAAHALYLDPFSPRVNPAPWAPAALRRFAGALAPGGVLATYSVSGGARRALEACGLEVERRPGPSSGKREWLRARRPLAPPPRGHGA